MVWNTFGHQLANHLRYLLKLSVKDDQSLYFVDDQPYQAENIRMRLLGEVQVQHTSTTRLHVDK